MLVIDGFKSVEVHVHDPNVRFVSVGMGHREFGAVFKVFGSAIPSRRHESRPA